MARIRYLKMVKNNDVQFFYGEFKNEKKKGQNFLTFQRGFEPQIFSNFPGHDLNFHGK